MNKKILALLMAILMVAMSSVAFAATEANSVIAEKNYTTDAAVLPTETLQFTSELASYTALGASEASAAPEGTPTLAGSLPTSAIVDGVGEITLASDAGWPEAGTYRYTVSETAGSIQGVEYDDSTIQVVVHVAYDKNNELYVETIGVESIAGQKDGSFDNNYDLNEENDWELTVSKTVTGNAANIEDEFDIEIKVEPVDNNSLDVSFTSIEIDGVAVALTNGVATTTIKHDEELVITGIPKGAKVTVTETDELVGTGEGKYEVSYTVDEETGNIAYIGENTTVAITNERDTTIDTGVTTDSMPYIMLMAFVMMIAAAVVLKKRTVNE